MSLHDLQKAVHVAKDKHNDFGGYSYRTAEGILAAIKAALPDGASIIVTDSLQEVAGQIFVTSTARISFADGATVEAQGHAMHQITKKGMDASQITGSASSYARKYALSGLMALDDGSVDPDARDNRNEGQSQPEPPSQPHDKPQWSSSKERDRLKNAIEKQTDPNALDKLWNQNSFKAMFANLDDPHKGELVKVYTDTAALLSEAY